MHFGIDSRSMGWMDLLKMNNPPDQDAKRTNISGDSIPGARRLQCMLARPFSTWMVCAFLAGCAFSTSEERRAFEVMQQAEAATYGGSPKAVAENDAGVTGAVLHNRAVLSDYLALAVRLNPGLEAAFQRWRAALYRVPQVRALPEPRISYAYYVREVETRTGPQQQRFGLSQAFPWFGTLQKKAAVAMAEATAAARAFEAAKHDVFLRVKRAYFEYAYLGRAIAITNESIALVTDLEEVARTRYKANLAGHPDIIRAQVELGKLENEVRALRDREAPLRAQLNAALGRAPRTPLASPPALPESAVMIDEDEIRQRLRERNPELHALDASVDRERAAIALANQGFYPSFALSAEYIDTDNAIIPNTPDSSRDPIIVGISLSLPLWLERTNASVREARARFSGRQRERDDRENRLLSDLERALYRYRDAGRTVDLYRNTLIPKAEQSLGATQEAYIGERVGFLDLIDAERVLLELRLAHDRAMTERAIGLAVIEKLVAGRVSAERQAAPSEETP